MVTRQRPRSTRLLVVVLVSISLAVITLDYRQGQDGPLAGFGRIALAAMAPLQKAVTTVTRPIGDFFSGLVHLPSLEDENQQLQDENSALRGVIARQPDLANQVQELADLLGLKESLVVPGTTIEGNETVVTQGYEVNGQRGLYPPGLVIGEVSQVIPGASDLQEFVTVRPAIDFAALEFVLVLQTQRTGS